MDTLLEMHRNLKNMGEAEDRGAAFAVVELYSTYAEVFALASIAESLSILAQESTMRQVVLAHGDGIPEEMRN